MKKVFLVENNCCGSGFNVLLAPLQKRLMNEAKVEVINLARTGDQVIIPKEIREKIASNGISFLPAIFVDGNLVSEKRIPNLMEAIELVQHN